MNEPDLVSAMTRIELELLRLSDEQQATHAIVEQTRYKVWNQLQAEISNIENILRENQDFFARIVGEQDKLLNAIKILQEHLTSMGHRQKRMNFELTAISEVIRSLNAVLRTMKVPRPELREM